MLRTILLEVLLPTVLWTLALVAPIMAVATWHWESTGENVCYDLNLWSDTYCDGQ